MGPDADSNLENIVWRCLTGSQAHLAAGTDHVRRFARGYSPIIGYANAAHAGLEELAPYCAPGERLYSSDWAGPTPPGWTLEVDTFMCAMLWRGREAPGDDLALSAVRLTDADVPRMVALAQLTRPGPFAERTFEMGEYFGVFEGGELVAMAGERMQSGRLREISGVCTRPGHEGRGLATRLTQLLMRRQLARGEIPFLHVASANARARAIYEALGFRVDREVPLRIVRRD